MPPSSSWFNWYPTYFFQKKNHYLFYLIMLSSFLLVDMEIGNHTILTEFILLGLSSDPKWQLILFGIFLMLYLITLSGNMTLVILIRIDSHLHTPMYFFIGNLSFLDFWYTSVYTPRILATCISEDKHMSLAGCGAQLFFSCVVAYSESYLLAVMAYDRHWQSVTRYFIQVLCPLLSVPDSWLAPT